MSQPSSTPLSSDALKPTIIFDGSCSFCIARVDSLKKLDKDQQFAFLPRQAERAETLFPQLKDIDLEEGILLIEPDNTTFMAADALYHIASRLSPINILTWIYRIPVLHQAIRLGYWIIARNRHHLGQSCSGDSCRLTVENGTEVPQNRQT